MRTVIQEGKTHQLDNIVATSLELGMISLDRALAQSVKERLIEETVARSQTLHRRISKNIEGIIVQNAKIKVQSDSAKFKS